MQGISGRNSQRALQLGQLPTGRGMGLRPMFSLSRAKYSPHKTPEAPSAPAPCFPKLHLVGMPPRCARTLTGHSREAPPPHPPGLHTCSSGFKKRPGAQQFAKQLMRKWNIFP